MRFTDVAVLSQALASGLVLAKPIEKRQTGASTVQSVGSYSYIGCAIEPFANGGNGRTLTNTTQSSNTMTVESCASFCSDYAYFSVEWSSECYCGDELASGTAIEADDTNCDFPCAGDSTEFCGGSAHQNLYSGPRASGNGLVTSSSVSSTTASSPTANAAVVVTSSTPVTTSVSTTAAATTSATSAAGNSYKYVTCAVEPFQNGADGRALIDASTSDDAMTVEYCASYCAGYTFFAVEYSSQCYCGNTIQTGTTQDVGDHCNMPCSGNSLEQCGGPGVMNLYEVSSGPVVTLPTTYSPATSTLSSAAASTPVSSSAAASTPVSSSAAASTPVSSSVAASTPVSSSAAASTPVSSSAVASTSSSSSAVVSNAAPTSAIASASKSSSAVASTSAASSSAPVSTSASSKVATSAVSTSTARASSAAPASTSSVTSSRSASSTASSFVTSTTSTRTSTSSSATKASTTAAAAASARPSSFFSIATCPKLSAYMGSLNIKNTFTPYFSGSGVTENCINPGASILFPARTFQIAGTNNACAAATLCIQQMSNLLVSYQSFDLHYRTDTARWECVAYRDNNVYGSFFNVRNPAVSVAYGFNGVASFF